MKTALNCQWEPTGDSPDRSHGEPISDSMIWMQMLSAKKRPFQLRIGAPQYITLGVFTAEPVTYWEITLPPWWKRLPCRKKIKAVDGWMVTGWSLIIWEIGLVPLHGLEMIWQPEQSVKIICFVIEAEGLFGGMAIGVILCPGQRPPSYQCPSIKKAAGEDTGWCSVISASLFIPFRSGAVTGLPSNA